MGEEKKSVNALVRATYISTIEIPEVGIFWAVSMPSYGQLTFLQNTDNLLRLKVDVSMPSYGQLTFLLFIGLFFIFIEECVNALVRATYISTR